MNSYKVYENERRKSISFKINNNNNNDNDHLYNEFKNKSVICHRLSDNPEFLINNCINNMDQQSNYHLNLCEKGSE